MNIVLQTNEIDKIVEFRNCKYIGSDTYECFVFVKSGWLQCERQFFFDVYYTQQFIKCLNEMNLLFKGDAELKAEYEDQSITVACSHLGKVVIKGVFIEHSTLSQTFEFGFETDQTIFSGLIKQFSKLLECRS